MQMMEKMAKRAASLAKARKKASVKERAVEAGELLREAIDLLGGRWPGVGEPANERFLRETLREFVGGGGLGSTRRYDEVVGSRKMMKRTPPSMA